MRSESDIHAMMELETEILFASNRQKRQRTDSPVDSDSLKDLHKEIIAMLQSWKAEQNSTFASWKAEQEKILKKLVTDISEVKEKCTNIEKTNMELERTLEFINKEYEDIKSRILVLEKDKKENRDCLINLEAKVNEFQRMSRSAAVEIRNIPQKDKETTSDLISIVSAVGRTVNTNLQPQDFRDIYRGPAKPGSVRNIVVDFTKVQTKQELLSSVRNFNKSRNPADKLNSQHIGIPGDKKPFYVDDHMPASTKKLFFDARAYAKEHGYRFCWTANSKVFLRKDQGSKPILVKSVQCLIDLGNSK